LGSLQAHCSIPKARITIDLIFPLFPCSCGNDPFSVNCLMGRSTMNLSVNGQQRLESASQTIYLPRFSNLLKSPHKADNLANSHTLLFISNFPTVARNTRLCCSTQAVQIYTHLKQPAVQPDASPHDQTRLTPHLTTSTKRICPFNQVSLLYKHNT